jgi:hypothetical protein
VSRSPGEPQPFRNQSTAAPEAAAIGPPTFVAVATLKARPGPYSAAFDCNRLILLVPQEGFEPPTPSLRMSWNGFSEDFRKLLTIAEAVENK